MNIKQSLIGTWKEFGTDRTLTFEPHGDLFMNDNKFVYVIVYSYRLNRWGLFAPEIGVKDGFFVSVDFADEIQLDIVSDLDELVVNENGEFIDGYQRLVFTRVK